MPRTWVIGIATTLVLLAMAMLLHRSHSAGNDTDGTESSDRHSRAGVSATDSRVARIPNRRGNSGFADSDESAPLDAALNRARQRAGRPGGAAAASGAENDNPGLEADGDDAPEAAAEAKAGKASPSSARNQPGAAGTSTEQASAAGAATSGTPGAGDNDPNGPAVSLKFDKSTVPDKGDAAPIVESGITLDEHGARFSEGAQFAIPHVDSVTGTAATVSFAILPEWVGETDSNASFFQWRTTTFQNRIQIFKNGRYLRFLFCDNTGDESGVGVDISDWHQGDTHVVTATWGDGVTALYVDGRSVGYREYNGELQIPAGTPWLIGSDYAGGAPGARSSIKDFHIFPRALSADEVTGLAAQSHP
ncbi:MAG: LamG domain-containing protein [Deltaproteobacteria bacterium]|nr:LamG domain-containing protein [Deltaproteobacteria bacterium]